MDVHYSAALTVGDGWGPTYGGDARDGHSGGGVGRRRLHSPHLMRAETPCKVRLHAETYR